jgi:hypothetical protein
LAGQTSSFAQGTLTAVGAGTTIALTGNALAASAGAMQSAGAVTVAGQALVSSTGVMVAQSAGTTTFFIEPGRRVLLSEEIRMVQLNPEHRTILLEA